MDYSPNGGLMHYSDLHEGDSIRYIPAASYLNFLITNGRVFAPAYWHEGKPASMKAKDEGMSITRIAEISGISRMTLHKYASAAISANLSDPEAD